MTIPMAGNGPRRDLPRRSLAQRVIGATLLHADSYEEIESDRSAGRPAFLIVAASAAAAGIGSFQNGGLVGIFWTTVAGLVGWWVWAWVAMMIGTRLLPGPDTEADHGELLRTLGFAAAPGLLRVFGFIPGLNPWLYLITGVWMLFAMVVAIRQALDYQGTGRAIAVCVIGWPIEMLFLVASLLATGPWPL